MKYEKPQIARLDKAVAAIQGGKQTYTQPDTQPKPNLITVSAYESDE